MDGEECQYSEPLPTEVLDSRIYQVIEIILKNRLSEHYDETLIQKFSYFLTKLDENDLFRLVSNEEVLNLIHINMEKIILKFQNLEASNDEKLPPRMIIDTIQIAKPVLSREKIFVKYLMQYNTDFVDTIMKFSDKTSDPQLISILEIICQNKTGIEKLFETLKANSDYDFISRLFDACETILPIFSRKDLIIILCKLIDHIVSESIDRSETNFASIEDFNDLEKFRKKIIKSFIESSLKKPNSFNIIFKNVSDQKNCLIVLDLEAEVINYLMVDSHFYQNSPMDWSKLCISILKNSENYSNNLVDLISKLLRKSKDCFDYYFFIDELIRTELPNHQELIDVYYQNLFSFLYCCLKTINGSESLKILDDEKEEIFITKTFKKCPKLFKLNFFRLSENFKFNDDDLLMFLEDFGDFDSLLEKDDMKFLILILSCLRKFAIDHSESRLIMKKIYSYYTTLNDYIRTRCPERQKNVLIVFKEVFTSTKSIEFNEEFLIDLSEHISSYNKFYQNNSDLLSIMIEIIYSIVYNDCFDGLDVAVLEKIIESEFSILEGCDDFDAIASSIFATIFSTLFIVYFTNSSLKKLLSIDPSRLDQKKRFWISQFNGFIAPKFDYGILKNLIDIFEKFVIEDQSELIRFLDITNRFLHSNYDRELTLMALNLIDLIVFKCIDSSSNKNKIFQESGLLKTFQILLENYSDSNEYILQKISEILQKLMDCDDRRYYDALEEIYQESLTKMGKIKAFSLQDRLKMNLLDDFICASINPIDNEFFKDCY